MVRSHLKKGKIYRTVSDMYSEDMFDEGRVTDVFRRGNKALDFRGLVPLANCTVEILDFDQRLVDCDVLFYVQEHNLTTYLDYKYLCRNLIEIVNYNRIWYDLNEKQ